MPPPFSASSTTSAGPPIPASCPRLELIRRKEQKLPIQKSSLDNRLLLFFGHLAVYRRRRFLLTCRGKFVWRRRHYALLPPSTLCSSASSTTATRAATIIRQQTIVAPPRSALPKGVSLFGEGDITRCLLHRCCDVPSASSVTATACPTLICSAKSNRISTLIISLGPSILVPPIGLRRPAIRLPLIHNAVRSPAHQH